MVFFNTYSLTFYLTCSFTIILCVTFSDTLFDILSHIFHTHIFWHSTPSIWNFLSHIFWHSIWHFLPHDFCHHFCIWLCLFSTCPLFSKGRMFDLRESYPRIIPRIIPPNHTPESYPQKSRFWMFLVGLFGIALALLVLMELAWQANYMSDESYPHYPLVGWFWLGVGRWLAGWLASGGWLAAWLARWLWQPG